MAFKRDEYLLSWVKWAGLTLQCALLLNVGKIICRMLTLTTVTGYKCSLDRIPEVITKKKAKAGNRFRSILVTTSSEGHVSSSTLHRIDVRIDFTGLLHAISSWFECQFTSKSKTEPIKAVGNPLFEDCLIYCHHGRSLATLNTEGSIGRSPSYNGRSNQERSVQKRTLPGRRDCILSMMTLR